MKKYDKEVLKYEVLYNHRSDYSGEDIIETFTTEEEAVEHARYILSTGFYNNVRVHQINIIIW